MHQRTDPVVILLFRRRKLDLVPLHAPFTCEAKVPRRSVDMGKEFIPTYIERIDSDFDASLHDVCVMPLKPSHTRFLLRRSSKIAVIGKWKAPELHGG